MRKRFVIAWMIVIAALLTVALTIAYLAPPRLDGSLITANISADSGFAYTSPISLRPPIGFLIASDGDATSNLNLYESGQLLGLAHSGHSEIREKGQGRYSHWRGRLWFSASDSSDPRTNGRSYSVSVRTHVHPYLPVAVALLDLLTLIILRRRLLSDARFRRIGGDIAMLLALVLAALVSAGVFGRINPSDSAPKDVPLVVAALLHSLFGCAILIAQWAAGAGIARLLLGASRATLANVLLLGFALSLPLVAVFAAVVLSLSQGFALAGAAWALCCLPLYAWRPAAGELAGVVRAGVAILPFAIGFGCWMSLHWHGPTETLAGSPSGDLVYYSTTIVSLATQLYPFLDLGYEAEPFNSYFNMLFPALGAALSRVVVLEPFLFITASGATSFVLSLGLTLYVYVRGTGILSRGKHVALPPVTLALAIIIAIRYPYWIVESIPMIHAVPLTLVVAYWARKNDVRARLLAFMLAVVGSALSKVVGVAVLAPFAVASAVPQFFRMSLWTRIAAIVAAVASVAYAAILLDRMGALFFGIAPLGPLSFNMLERYHADLWTALPFALRDGSAVLLAVVAFVLVDWTTAAAIAFGFLLFLIHPFLFQFDFICAAIILAVVACDNPERLWRFRWLILGALLLALPAALFTDPAGTSSGLAWLVCIGGTVWVALSSERPLISGGPGRTAAAAALILGLVLVAIIRGYLILDSGWRPPVLELTPQVRQIWLVVKERTPPDALIFTDQTGIEPTLLGSWNTYAFIGARQIFVSNLYMNPATRLNRQRALAVLRQNDAVLDGTLAPAQLKLRDRYSGYFAVVSRSRSVPAQWIKIFENEQFVLFRIAPAA